MIKLAFMGDTFLKTKDGTNPFTHVMPLLQDADIRILNLEAALTDKPLTAQKHIRIRTHPDHVKWLQEAGIDMVNAVNNHTMDCGRKGFIDTRNNVAISGIWALGYDYPIIKQVKNSKLCFLSYRLFENETPDNLFSQIKAAAGLCDILVISLHWGQEHMPTPSPWQIETAHKIIDAGAKILVGHHPHCLQGIERYNNGLIAYSLGNFNFWHEDVKTKWFNRIAPILIVSVGKEDILSYCTNYCKIDNNYAPVPISIMEHGDLWNLEDALSANIGAYTEKEWYNLLGYQYITQTINSSLFAIKSYGFNPLWRFIKWLCRPHTHKAFFGMIRKGKVDRWKQYSENLAP